jgi:hypothetical protein
MPVIACCEQEERKPTEKMAKTEFNKIGIKKVCMETATSL